MNKKDPFEDDLLINYINPERIEKAPEGFTSKTMTRIQIETESKRSRKWIISGSPVPLISLIITLLLTAAAILIPSDSNGQISSLFLKLFSNYSITIPKLYFSSAPELNLPVWIIYSSLVIVFLAVFDRLLGTLFRKERS
jgi:hypothetical protein